MQYRALIFVGVLSFYLAARISAFAAEAPSPEPTQAEEKASQAESSEPSVASLGNEFSIFYQNSLQSFQQDQTSIAGARPNQLQASGQIRLQPEWILRLAILGDRANLELPQFTTGKVFSSDAFLGELSLNYRLGKTDHLEWAGGLSYLYTSYTPDNLDQNQAPIPFTNTVLDYHYTSQGPGFSLLGLWQITPPLSLLAQAGLYPYLFTSVQKGSALPYLGMGRATLQLRYQIVEGFLLALSASQELGWGAYLNSNTSLGLGLTLVPDRISQE
ncbi:hypothetical protein COW36_13200 [bacterium (Candidatus Blackallbacteria) CG17_big_fil_post_rev_8_21_14_2_50_48_46]|uniref:Transporter n=1 Tax=bacterium (Candidatus Blackallbacteria) CG17_big_fil_post_rev_8_21_14_2_50_48_46 TaxID=2014261 RepID=A0A2M7G4A4_9BACT|nr:MAG: hypothetical protein COW64_02070 [bacterium (Candidatus Blackallbacteria) CG18_big_fil_WC_8_21_14_2_50_49_26]PIW16716.1 MAG: hypothetical protein COW36_13200 [bacterium (Candidatus Blackallbacteria) CG17_big_fil_post_rev_8_21_14_2_50_48_46]PIW46222.1 MAG: hypothetical protein COW20_18450 [bacterium (Candidatus Blackallbacteria) CG13_big_fil_rev_8_21_14_2_50_49_14]